MTKPKREDEEVGGDAASVQSADSVSTISEAQIGQTQMMGSFREMMKSMMAFRDQELAQQT